MAPRRVPALDPGELVAVPGGFACRGCGATVERLWRDVDPRRARCVRCLGGRPPRRQGPIAVQPRLPLG